MKNPNEFLQEVKDQYGSLKSYRDEGTVRLGTDLLRFQTHFKRPNLLRFEWTGHLDEEREDYAIDDGRSTILLHDGVNSFYFDPRHPDFSGLVRFKSIGEGLAFDGMYSGFATELIVPLLSSSFESSTFSREFTEFSFDGMDEFEGKACQRFVSKELLEHEEVSSYTVWISSDTNCISRVAIKRRTPKHMKEVPELAGHKHPKVREGYKIWLDKDDIEEYSYEFSVKSGEFSSQVFDNSTL